MYDLVIKMILLYGMTDEVLYILLLDVMIELIQVHDMDHFFNGEINSIFLVQEMYLILLLNLMHDLIEPLLSVTQLLLKIILVETGHHHKIIIYGEM